MKFFYSSKIKDKINRGGIVLEPIDWIKKKRLEKGYTQEYIAKQLYIAKSTYSQYENGKRRIDIETYQKIKNILEFHLQLTNPDPLKYDIIAYSTYHCYERDDFEVFFKPIQFYLVPKKFLLWAEGEFFENSSGLFKEEIDPDSQKLEFLGINIHKEYEAREKLTYELSDYFYHDPNFAKGSKLAKYVGDIPILLETKITPEEYKKLKRNKVMNLDVPQSFIFEENTWNSLEKKEFTFKAIDYCTHWDN
jgi:transcriptional regulator with XRE-family HTH domain